MLQSPRALIAFNHLLLAKSLMGRTCNEWYFLDLQLDWLILIVCISFCVVLVFETRTHSVWNSLHNQISSINLMEIVLPQLPEILVLQTLPCPASLWQGLTSPWVVNYPRLTLKSQYSCLNFPITEITPVISFTVENIFVSCWAQHWQAEFTEGILEFIKNPSI